MAQIHPYPKLETDSESPHTSSDSLLIHHKSSVAARHLFQSSLKLSTLALYIGAGLSIIDLLFDLAMVREYAESDEPGFAKATLITIGLNMVLQLIIAIAQNAKRGKRVMLREAIFVVAFIKPGVDVYRVVTGQKHAVNAMFDPMTEMTISKVAELFAESIPSAIVQTMAFVNSRHHTKVAALSLASSILTSAFISASIAIEKDLDGKGREHSPNFYGFVLKGYPIQTVAVSLLVLTISACQLTSKAFAIALCNIESSTILVAYLGIDFGLAFVVKVLRHDVYYWWSIESKPVRVVASILVRIVTKTVLDFTGLFQLRHSYEFGGLYFMTVILTTPFVCVYFGYRYLAYVEDEEVALALNYVFTSEQIYGGLGLLTIVQLSSFAIIMYIIPSTHKVTFWSTQTASQYTCSNFLELTDDNAKIELFTNHASFRSPIEDEVKTWLNERLPVWISEEPEWFDDQRKSTVPDDYVKDPVMLKKIRGIEVEKIRERRRTSLVLITG